MKSKMDKIKNYNQVLLAIAGTCALLFIIFSGVMILIEFWPREYEEEGMIATEISEELAEQRLKRKLFLLSTSMLLIQRSRLFCYQ